jgi:hypothetical protein
MERYQKLRGLKTLLCLIFLFVGVNSMAQEPSDGVLKVANDGLISFLKQIPKGAMEEYGFAKDDNLDEAYLGSAFRLHNISPEVLSMYQSNDSVSSVISETDIWYFIVVVNDETKSILIVEKSNDEWKTVGLGYASLAKELDIILKQWPRQDGFNPLLIVVFQAQEYLFTIPEIDEYNLTPVLTPHKAVFTDDYQRKSTSKSLKESPKYSELANVSNVVKRIKPIVEENIKRSSQ